MRLPQLRHRCRRVWTVHEAWLALKQKQHAGMVQLVSQGGCSVGEDDCRKFIFGLNSILGIQLNDWLKFLWTIPVPPLEACNKSCPQVDSVQPVATLKPSVVVTPAENGRVDAQGHRFLRASEDVIGMSRCQISSIGD